MTRSKSRVGIKLLKSQSAGDFHHPGNAKEDGEVRGVTAGIGGPTLDAADDSVAVNRLEALAKDAAALGVSREDVRALDVNNSPFLLSGIGFGAHHGFVALLSCVFFFL